MKISGDGLFSKLALRLQTCFFRGQPAFECCPRPLCPFETCSSFSSPAPQSNPEQGARQSTWATCHGSKTQLGTAFVQTEAGQDPCTFEGDPSLQYSPPHPLFCGDLSSVAKTPPHKVGHLTYRISKPAWSLLQKCWLALLAELFMLLFPKPQRVLQASRGQWQLNGGLACKLKYR